MQPIKEILFPTDFSESAQSAFRFCLQVADKLKASIRLIHVVIPDYEATDLAVITASAVAKKVEAAKEVIKDFVNLGLTQVQAETKLEVVPEIISDVEVGQPASSITTKALQNDIPLIIMGTLGEKDAINRVWGSLTGSVVSKTDSMVWVVPDGAKFDKMDVVAYATNLDEADPFHIWKMARFFQPFQSSFHCVHVAHKDDLKKEISLEDIESILSKEISGLDLNFHKLHDIAQSTDDQLETFVADKQVDTLILLKQQHTLWERLFRRSHTRYMTLHSKVPILIRK